MSNKTTNSTSAPAAAVPVENRPWKAAFWTDASLFGGDIYLWGIYATLILVSIVELYSASSREVSPNASVYTPIIRHALQLLGGFVILVLVQRIHYRHFIKAIPLFAMISLIMGVYVFFWGQSINSATRSFTFIISIQPSEFLKITVVLVIAMVLALTQNRTDPAKRAAGMWTVVVVVTVCAGLLIRDGLTNTIILIGISMAMMLIGGIRMKQLLMVLAIYMVLGCGYLAVSYVIEKNRLEAIEQLAKTDPVAAARMAEESGASSRIMTRVNRVLNYVGVSTDTSLDEVAKGASLESDNTPMYKRELTTDNMQEMYSYYAQANGGAIGVFPGNSRETSRLPLAFTDFIYSIIIEDLGMVGGIGLMLLYLWLLMRAAGIASKCHDAFPALLVIGMAVMIVSQALIHMAVATGVSPVTGQPLPLISKGGSSILIVSLAFGIMLSVSRYAPGYKNAKRKVHVPEGADADALPEEMSGANPGQLSI